MGDRLVPRLAERHSFRATLDPAADDSNATDFDALAVFWMAMSRCLVELATLLDVAEYGWLRSPGDQLRKRCMISIAGRGGCHSIFEQLT